MQETAVFTDDPLGFVLTDGENEMIETFDLDVQERMLVFRDVALLRAQVREP